MRRRTTYSLMRYPEILVPGVVASAIMPKNVQLLLGELGHKVLGRAKAMVRARIWVKGRVRQGCATIVGSLGIQKRIAGSCLRKRKALGENVKGAGRGSTELARRNKKNGSL